MDGLMEHMSDKCNRSLHIGKDLNQDGTRTRLKDLMEHDEFTIPDQGEEIIITGRGVEREYIISDNDTIVIGYDIGNGWFKALFIDTTGGARIKG